MTDKDRLEGTLDELDVTDNNDLRELIKEWRATPEYLKLHRGKYEAADELEELIE